MKLPWFNVHVSVRITRRRAWTRRTLVDTYGMMEVRYEDTKRDVKESQAVAWEGHKPGAGADVLST
jgi:hypothetical protein